MIIGIDNGYTYTKDSKGNIFPSKVRTGDDIDINNVLRVEIEGQKYVVGEKESNFTVDTNKINDEKTLINILTSIALSVDKPYEEVRLITVGKGVRLTFKLYDIMIKNNEEVIGVDNMARKPRIHYKGVFYHVIVRGNNKYYVFQADEMKKIYLKKIKKYIEKYDCKLYYYVIMLCNNG